VLPDACSDCAAAAREEPGGAGNTATLPRIEFVVSHPVPPRLFGVVTFFVGVKNFL
jgi:hypothetical protein